MVQKGCLHLHHTTTLLSSHQPFDVDLSRLHDRTGLFSLELNSRSCEARSSLSKKGKAISCRVSPVLLYPHVRTYANIPLPSEEQ